ncbi:MAG: 2-C-methyl-D-erythritol 2,4-cyclodiphosphate synthase [Omnitrophica WOR_2 bacterium RIFCSPLOWO2_01_FULL_41_12]|nr:MAG: 2-C-methyl-D-erythritol 2,4-cyclodiphosphate synthase [Omnitrophica WOR_2 bacterium RIFCSPLOWO2_01_FULL_41_12]
MDYRTGIGYDIHRLVEGRKLFIGGVEIPYLKGLLGHSDGDALLHAICDALLGAVACDDLGTHFPDTDPKYQGIPSRELLKTVADLVKNKGYRINNLDTVVIAQEPRLTPFKKQIQQSIAAILGIDAQCLNIKAKTNEGLGEIGSKEAIACYAVVTIKGEI